MFVRFVCMVRKYLVGQYCKNEVFGLKKMVDDFDYCILHHLIENNFVHNNEVDFWMVFICITFILFKKWVISTLFL